ncbi:hypothetical protein F2Q68_00041491 [Brassica cretica]|uniref:Uncharacterized protein n=2 Tax=Brassica cretica TaxID=69181 RepID=A0ABQ7F2V9_BRACR|nr:hypothetical protein F2Q68_00041491 [Brassica cretica]KAF3609545.1 hypothetical protein DY000_02050512 [Brassica cretica]
MANILKSTIGENDAFSSPNLRLIPTMVMAESMKDKRRVRHGGGAEQDQEHDGGSDQTG